MNDSTYSAEPAEVPKTNSKLGCILGGCLGVVGFMVVGIAVTSYMGYRFATGQVEKYTSATPRVLPVVEYTDGEMVELGARLNSVTGENGPAQQVTVSADDFNALLARHPSGEFKGKVYITFADGDVKAEVSLPVDEIPGGKGRFLNGSVTAHVSAKDGELILQATDITVNGEKLPQQFVDVLGNEKLTNVRFNSDDLEKLEVVGDKLILTPIGFEAAAEPAGELKAQGSEVPSGE